MWETYDQRNLGRGNVIESAGVSCSSLLTMMISLPLSQPHKGQRSILLVHQTQLKTSCCHMYSSCIFHFMMFVWHICLFLLLAFPRTHLARTEAKHQRLERAPNLQKTWRNVGNCWKGHIMDYFALFSMSERGTICSLHNKIPHFKTISILGVTTITCENY